ncbi:MAG: hypothetical protein K0R05_2727 [Anaerocolumna sp.]|nr:hypothetical protein [Anaerocolumna sp.]
MQDCYYNEGDIKRKIRNLKKMEMRLRFHQIESGGVYKGWETCKSIPKKLVWDEFFCLQDNCKNVRYNMKDLMSLDRNELKKIIGQFYYAVFYRKFQETGMMDSSLYNPDILMKMGLPIDSDAVAIKKRFRELAKEYHPDAGGSSEQFVELLEQINSLHLRD